MKPLLFIQIATDVTVASNGFIYISLCAYGYDFFSVNSETIFLMHFSASSKICHGGIVCEVSFSLNKLNLRWWGRKSVINENHYKTILKNFPRSSSYGANNSWRKWLQSSLFMHNWAERKLKNYRNSTSPICMTVFSGKQRERENENRKKYILVSSHVYCVPITTSKFCKICAIVWWR